MSFLSRLSSADSQNFVCSQSELLAKLFLTAVATAAARRSPRALISSVYPLPEFNIGDLVAEDWLDEFDKNATDFGEIRGLSYVPDNSSDYPPKTWVYYVYWTSTTCGCDSSYPCYDDIRPITGDHLRLVKQS